MTRALLLGMKAVAAHRSLPAVFRRVIPGVAFMEDTDFLSALTRCGRVVSIDRRIMVSSHRTDMRLAWGHI